MKTKKQIEKRIKQLEKRLESDGYLQYSIQELKWVIE